MKLTRIGLEIRNAKKYSIIRCQELNDLQDMLPHVIRNLTLDSINFYSCSYGVLHAVKSYTLFSNKNYTDQRVAAQVSGKVPIGGKWRLELTDDDSSVYMKNTFTNEYLYAEKSKYFSSSHRKVSLATSPSGYEFMWTLEYDGTYIRILNLEYSGENLVTSTNHYGINRYIYTDKYSERWQNHLC